MATILRDLDRGSEVHGAWLKNGDPERNTRRALAVYALFLAVGGRERRGAGIDLEARLQAHYPHQKPRRPTLLGWYDEAMLLAEENLPVTTPWAEWDRPSRAAAIEILAETNRIKADEKKDMRDAARLRPSVRSWAEIATLLAHARAEMSALQRDTAGARRARTEVVRMLDLLEGDSGSGGQ